VLTPYPGTALVFSQLPSPPVVPAVILVQNSGLSIEGDQHFYLQSGYAANSEYARGEPLPYAELRTHP